MLWASRPVEFWREYETNDQDWKSHWGAVIFGDFEKT